METKLQLQDWTTFLFIDFLCRETDERASGEAYWRWEFNNEKQTV